MSARGTLSGPKSRPIIYSWESIEAFLNTLPGGKPKDQSLPVKTMTRRIVNPQPQVLAKFERAKGGESSMPWCGGWGLAFTVRGKVHSSISANSIVSGVAFNVDPTPCPYGVPGDSLWVRESVLEVFGKDWESEPVYRGDGVGPLVERMVEGGKARWRSPRFMFKRHARYMQKILAIRVERLQEITEADARLEGARKNHGVFHDSIQSSIENTYVRNFAVGWDRLNAKRGFSWDSNPWIWVLTVGGLEKFVMHPDKKK